MGWTTPLATMQSWSHCPRVNTFSNALIITTMSSRDNRIEIRTLRREIDFQQDRIAELEGQLAKHTEASVPPPPDQSEGGNSAERSGSTNSPPPLPTEEELRIAVTKIDNKEYESIRHASRATGIGRNRLGTALKRFKAGESICAKMGRRVYWNQAMNQRLTAKLSELTREGAAAMYVCYQKSRTVLTHGTLQPELVPDSIENLIYTIHNDVLESQLGRKLYGKESKFCSYRTLLRIMKNKNFRMLIATAKTDRQNERRREAMADAYNFVCLAVQALIMFPPDYSQSLVFNYDKTSVNVHHEDLSLALFSAEAAAEMLAQNQNVTITENSKKSRNVALGVLTAANGSLTRVVIYLKDEKFNNTPATIVKLTEEIFITYFGTNMKDDAEKLAFDCCFIPGIIKEQARYKARISGEYHESFTFLDGASEPSLVPLSLPRAYQSVNDSAAGAATAATGSETLSNIDDRMFTLLTLDGELPQVNAYLDAPEVYFENGISVFKFSAACSKKQQPNDCMKSFQIVKKYYRSRKSKIVNEKNVQYADYVVLVKNHLEKAGIDKNSVETFVRFVGQLPTVLSSAFSIHNIQDGWAISGLGGPQGFDCRKIMSQWTGWNNLNLEEQNLVVEKIHKIATKICDNVENPYNGEVLDSVMEAELKDLLGRANPAQRQTDSEGDANGICVSLWRSLLLTKDFKEMIDKRKAARAERRNAAANSEGSHNILQPCHTCSASFWRVKWQRPLYSDWRVCRKCKKKKYFCPESACLKAFENHPQHTLEPAEMPAHNAAENYHDTLDAESCGSEDTEDLFWLYGGREIPTNILFSSKSAGEVEEDDLCSLSLSEEDDSLHSDVSESEYESESESEVCESEDDE